MSRQQREFEDLPTSTTMVFGAGGTAALHDMSLHVLRSFIGALHDMAFTCEW